MNFYVYLIHNIKNNKIYVGKTISLKRRWSNHLSFARNKTTNQFIHRAIRKYGVDNFIFCFVQKLFSNKECAEAERYWIKYYDSRNPKYGYNLTDGGDGSIGRKQTTATREKISARKKNTMLANDNPFYGKKHTTQTKAIISSKNTGLKRTDAFRKEKSSRMIGDKNHFYGKKHTTDALGKISGESSSSAKLSVQQVYEIINMYKNTKQSQKKIASVFGISQSQVCRIIRGQAWKVLENK
jgi:group I intron endonuclease